MKTTTKQNENTAEPRYALRKGLGFWELTFDGQRAVFKHEQGASYAACLLLHPPEEPLHGLALELKVNDQYSRSGGATEMVDPETGVRVLIEAGAVLQERNLALDDAQAAQGLRREQRKLEALLEDEAVSEPVKAEVRRELEELYEYQRQHPWRVRDAAQNAAEAVARALKRLHQHLASAVDAAGQPVPVLRSFAEHLRQHLLLPSGRGWGRKGRQPAPEAAGRFTYEPPAGVVWHG